MFAIKKVGPTAIPVIQKLSEITWAVTYASILPPEQMAYMLDLFYSNESLRKQMQQQHHQFIVAMDNDEAVGFASYSPKIGEQKNVYRLHKLYIHPNQQKRGTGKKMLQSIILDIKSKGAKILELNVNRSNPAVEFYKKMQFRTIKVEDIDIGNGYFMNDYVMALEL